ncbi:fumarylacetoacetate hydrolase [Cordyceps fumosorosea ARSEF 2679]|uniref:Fumarylacetoacetate hydrolase n=1 Tax=Cordyceps fumosorosea (strain ARSEF 2679) TaxID=1081104 RepID=A0A162M7P9_CORFA|nr:fumarylacetoacetate hydrolase [Cordyceps fumosorosea ARSEF 2679]OAA52140.1 fumarylacetoacetate hydrolase [Cordyceps fumosorosea ARSEF 2679]
MAPFQYLSRFETAEGDTFYANVGSNNPTIGSKVQAYPTYEDLLEDRDARTVVIAKVLPPLPRPDLPIYCVGLNYKSHAVEASLNVPVNPPIWTKPAAALSSPDETIPFSRFCASHLPDWEGELVFVTSRECRDITPTEALDYILGYTIGNDLTCRFFQLPEQSGGQFFYAKAFDKFAPVGPVLVSSSLFPTGVPTGRLVTCINGEVKQDTSIAKDMIFLPQRILSWMSQSTTIPAFSVVMTGTPAGVGVFQRPRQLLKDGDRMEVEIAGLGTLKNTVKFENGQDSIL